MKRYSKRFTGLSTSREGPTAQEMNDHGEFSRRPYFNRWEGWQAAIRAAGYEPVGRPSGPDNYNWKEQPAHEWREYGDNWEEQRQKALERDNYTCQTPDCEWTQEAHREEFTRGASRAPHSATKCVRRCRE